MAMTATQVTFDTPAPEFSASGDRRQDLRTGRPCGQKGHRRRLHLQPLPLRQSGDRPHGGGLAGAHI